MIDTTKHFRGGIPTQPDVQKLLDTFGVPPEDQLIPYGAIEKLIDCDRKSSRFITVCHKWRRRLEQMHNVFMQALDGEGYFHCPPDRRVDTCGRRMASNLRGIRRNAKRAATTETARLSEEARLTRDHLVNIAATVSLHAQLHKNPAKLPAPAPLPVPVRPPKP